MAITLSAMLPLGTRAPDFNLLDTVSGKYISLQDLKSPRGTVIMFICNHCPFVKYVRSEIIRIAATYKEKGVAFIAINSNDADAYPEDSPKKMAAIAQSNKFSFPYLFDETQKVAKAYHAVCTPDFFVFDKDLRCVYRGQLDDARPGNSGPDGADIRAALDCLLEGKPINPNQKPSMGCNIKWKY